MKLVEIVLVHKFSRPNDFTHKGINYFYLNRHSKNISHYLGKYLSYTMIVNRVFKNVYKDGMGKIHWLANNDSVIILHNIIHKLYYNSTDYREKNKWDRFECHYTFNLVFLSFLENCTLSWRIVC